MITKTPKPFLSVVIPAFNEAMRLPATLKAVSDFLNDQPFTSEIIVVDNASTDDTYLLAVSHGKRIHDFKVIQEPVRGKGQAVKAGMLAARGEYRFICDADLSMPIAEILKFLPPALTKIDVAIASREVNGAKRYQEPSIRHIIGRIFNILVRWLAVPGLQDTQCGFKCFRADVVEPIFSRMTMSGWAFDVELLVIAQQNGFTIHEVPIQWYYGPHSKLNVLQDSYRMLKDLLIIHSNIQNKRYH